MDIGSAPVLASGVDDESHRTVPYDLKTGSFPSQAVPQHSIECGDPSFQLES
jgi:hypothetical protein